MNTKDGYAKKSLTSTRVLTADGGDVDIDIRYCPFDGTNMELFAGDYMQYKKLNFNNITLNSVELHSKNSWFNPIFSFKATLLKNTLIFFRSKYSLTGQLLDGNNGVGFKFSSDGSASIISLLNSSSTSLHTPDNYNGFTLTMAILNKTVYIYKNHNLLYSGYYPFYTVSNGCSSIEHVDIVIISEKLPTTNTMTVNGIMDNIYMGTLLPQGNLLA